MDSPVADVDGAVADADGAVADVDGAVAGADGSVGAVDAGSGTDPSFEAEMTYTTANIGRTYDTRAQVAAVFDHIGDVMGGRSGPRFIGWQEIGEGDPCGTCEIEELRARFKTESGWETLRPRGTRPNGGTEKIKVPVTSKGPDSASAAAVFASPGWAGVSPTRFVTVVDYPTHNLSMINTHFIAGAWSCKSEVAKRRDYWRQAWNTLKDQVAKEHDRGRDVIVTGDLNRPRSANDCNPAWDPTSLHANAKVIGGAGIDYIFAVPAAGWKFVLAKRTDGTVERGKISLAIDGHKAHWVAGRFRPL
ncbi:MAG TPA: hypothetical protein VFG83_11125 [Kofleriaceae bacterium]|nr:hypothetical protein [Kofleriaceae bacterium]